MSEPTKVCAGCKQPKPWSDFYAKVKWLDGTTRQPQSRCKVCHAAAVAANREPQRRYDRRMYRLLRNDPEAWKRRLESQRFQYRARRGVVVRIGKHSEHPLLEGGPFAAWLRWVMWRDDASVRELALRLGLGDKTLRRILGGQGLVDLATVERALIADGGLMLRDVYPGLYEVAA